MILRPESPPGLVKGGKVETRVDSVTTTQPAPKISPSPGHLSIRKLGRLLLSATRPRQWPKNVLVLAAPTAAGSILRPGVLGSAIAAVWIFVAASACTYLVNDIVDRESDRRHPSKRNRPIASGALPPRAATTAAVVLGVVSVSTAALVNTSFATLIAGYLTVSLAYSFGLKRLPIVELACVGSGFTLRAVAGGAATHVAISPWFLVMTSFGALLIVSGKRTSEKAVLGVHQGSHRKVLDSYSTHLLGALRLLAISVTVTTYCLWAFERADAMRGAERAAGLIWFELSIIPFTLAVLVLEQAFSRGRGGQPEELALSDRLLQFLGIVWAALVLLGIYA